MFAFLFHVQKSPPCPRWSDVIKLLASLSMVCSPARARSNVQFVETKSWYEGLYQDKMSTNFRFLDWGT